MFECIIDFVIKLVSSRYCKMLSTKPQQQEDEPDLIVAHIP
jgi:hypothetical protein